MSIRAVTGLRRADKHSKNEVKNKSKNKKALALGLSAAIFVSGTSSAQAALIQGDKGERVEALQRSLQELELMEYPDAAGYFGVSTRNALMSFQRIKGIDANGVADDITIRALNDALTEKYPVLSYSRPLSLSCVGDDVAKAQIILKKLGYLGTKPDGVFSLSTASAVRTFQFDYGFNVDGVITRAIVMKLNRIMDSIRPIIGDKEEIIPEDIPVVEEAPKGPEALTNAIMMDWDTVSVLWPEGMSASVYDIYSGEKFFMVRTGGEFHADVEAPDANEASIIKERVASGGWSWSRRPVIVELDMFAIAGSLCLMPHGEKTLYTNDIEGHFCLYFSRSLRHDTQMPDKAHEKAVFTASEFNYVNI